MQIIIRDDDTSFFTPPEMLLKVYAPLWDVAIPVSLSVIPAHYANIRIPQANAEAGDFIDPNIPPRFRGQDQRFPITDNAVLCTFLSDLQARERIEICLHGFDHDWMEFKAEAAPLLSQKLHDGRQLLDAAFPDAPIRTFIAPYDGISSAAFTAIIEAGYHTQAHPANLPANPFIHGCELRKAYRLPAGNTLFTSHPLDPLTAPDAWLADAEQRRASSDVLIIVNHYWMFFDEWGSTRDDMLANWHHFMREVHRRFSDSLVTFSTARTE